MTEEQWAELKPYAEAETAARLAFTNAQIMNTPLDPRRRLEQDAHFERVRIEMQEASAVLEMARRRVLAAEV